MLFESPALGNVVVLAHHSVIIDVVTFTFITVFVMLCVGWSLINWTRERRQQSS